MASVSGPSMCWWQMGPVSQMVCLLSSVKWEHWHLHGKCRHPTVECGCIGHDVPRAGQIRESENADPWLPSRPTVKCQAAGEGRNTPSLSLRGGDVYILGVRRTSRFQSWQVTWVVPGWRVMCGALDRLTQPAASLPVRTDTFLLSSSSG